MHAAAAVLLVIGGAAKIARPGTAGDLFETLGLPPTAFVRFLTRGLGLFEIGLGTGALAVGGTIPAAGVAFGYTVFAAATYVAMTEGASDCGCFGVRDVPPSWLHVLADLALALASFNAISRATPVEVMEDLPADGTGFVVVVGLIAGLFLAWFTVVPKALASRRSGRSRA